MDETRNAKMREWLKRIRETEPEEISCSECFDMVSVYVDLEVAGEPVEIKLPQLKQHINQCLVCREEYELLRDLATAEEEGLPPSVEDILQEINKDRPGN